MPSGYTLTSAYYDDVIVIVSNFERHLPIWSDECFRLIRLYIQKPVVYIRLVVTKSRLNDPLSIMPISKKWEGFVEMIDRGEVM